MGGLTPLYNGIQKFLPGSVAYWGLFLGLYETFRPRQADYSNSKKKGMDSSLMLLWTKSLFWGWTSSTFAGLVTSPLNINGLSSAFAISNLGGASLFYTSAARGLRGGIMISLFDLMQRLSFLEK